MPVQDLSKTLKCLLDVLVDVNTLQSWNIFEEKNGQVVVKLRFDSGHYSPPSKGPVAFKRKSTDFNQHCILQTTILALKWPM